MGLSATYRKNLINDIEDYMKTFAETYAREGQKMLTLAAKVAIYQFYEDYTPEYYDRTFDLRNNSYLPYYHNNGRAIYGGVRITSEKMSPYQPGRKFETDPFDVATWAWVKGWHGHPDRLYKKEQKSEPPLNMLIEFKNDKEFLDKIYQNAEKVAVSKEYKVFRVKK